MACNAMSLVLFGSLITPTIYVFVFTLLLIVNEADIGDAMQLNLSLPTIFSNNAFQWCYHLRSYVYSLSLYNWREKGATSF